jgi:hypothetical protein
MGKDGKEEKGEKRFPVAFQRIFSLVEYNYFQWRNSARRA